MGETTKPVSLASLSDRQRTEAMTRFTLLQPHLEMSVPLARAARDGGVALRTARRWLRRDRAEGLVGLVRPALGDAGQPKLLADLKSLIEGLALRKPRRTVAALDREVTKIATEREVAAPSYATVHAIVHGLDPTLTTLAHEGAAAFRNRYELIHRHRMLLAYMTIVLINLAKIVKYFLVLVFGWLNFDWKYLASWTCDNNGLGSVILLFKLVLD